MTILDILLFLLISASAATAMIRGFRSEIASLLSFLLTVIVVYSFPEKIKSLLVDVFGNVFQNFALVLCAGFIIIYICFRIVAWFIVHLINLTKGQELMKYEIWDKTLGLVYGVIRGYVIIGIVFVVLFRVQPNIKTMPLYKDSWSKAAIESSIDISNKFIIPVYDGFLNKENLSSDDLSE